MHDHHRAFFARQPCSNECGKSYALGGGGSGAVLTEWTAFVRAMIKPFAATSPGSPVSRVADSETDPQCPSAEQPDEGHGVAQCEPLWVW